MISIILFVAGVLAGALLTSIVLCARSAGVLHIVENTEPGEAPYMFLELKRGASLKRHIWLTVSHKQDLPHE